MATETTTAVTANSTTATVATNDEPTLPTPSALRAALSTDGFVIIRSLLSPTKLASLRAATTSTIALARSGAWPHIRTVPKQFPPWPSTPPSDGAGIWGVQHLLHPDLPGHDAYASAYFDAGVMGVARALLSGNDADSDAALTDDDLVMELWNLLVGVTGRDFELRWHRDDVPASLDAAGEARALGLDERGNKHATPAHAQWNLALYDDESLVVVPGSHRRPRTDEERAADPFAPDLSGMRHVRLGPGDVVFYDNNILHRGVYRKGVERATLHGSVGVVGRTRQRARNVLQHGVGAWVDRCDFGALEPDVRARAESMRQRLVLMGREAGDVGFYSKDE
ncbi:phytanoyl-CoA dioxygenase family protein [Phyllosticta citriasiana]|uniref:phytanoyl-CoA dioxygenase family protein n=1 Tax=Phyllosticta citriasiana TaxID=595635 RepID=UPI0030FDD099